MLNIILALLCLYTAYPILTFVFPKTNSTQDPSTRKLPSTISSSSYSWLPDKHPLIAIVWRTYTPLTLRRYDGTAGDGNDSAKILIGVRGKVYDVTLGKDFYGPGGPYEVFAGRDASRGLAKQSYEPDVLTPISDPLDPLEDITPSEWENMQGWESVFRSKYLVCGDLVSAS